MSDSETDDTDTKAYALRDGLNLIVDAREHELIERLPVGKHPGVHVKSLLLGDAHIVLRAATGGETLQMVIERKEGHDALASLGDGRLHEQTARLMQASEIDGAAVMFILEGFFALGGGGAGIPIPAGIVYARAAGPAQERAISTFAFKIQVNHGWLVHHTRDVADTAALLLRIIDDATLVQVWPCGAAAAQKAVRAVRAAAPPLARMDQAAYMSAAVHRIARGPLTAQQRTVAMLVQAGLSETNALAVQSAYPTLLDVARRIEQSAKEMGDELTELQEGERKRAPSLDVFANLERSAGDGAPKRRRRVGKEEARRLVAAFLGREPK